MAEGCRTCVAVVLAGISLLVASAPVSAAADPTRLGITAVGQKTTFFDLSMAPGEKRTLSALLTNASTDPIIALTYAADVYTVVNGGLGVALRGQPATGTTTWLDYSTDSIRVQPAESIRRDFTVSVPADASPGDYITSLVLENRDPIQGSGGVALNQIVRHALAVAISVPGPRFPALHVSSAAHSVVGGRSVVSLAVDNAGNTQLTPVGEFHLSQATGREVSHSLVTMGSFYAKTQTHVEIALAERLQPGHYTAVLALGDAGTGLSITSDPLPFDVAGPSVRPQGRVDTIPGSVLDRGVPVWLFATAIVVAVLAALIIPALWRRRSTRANADRGGG